MARRTGRPRAGEEAQGTVDEEHRQPVHCGPSQKLRARTAIAGQDSRLGEGVQGGAQKLEASLPGSRRAGGAPQVLRRRKRRPGQACLVLGEPQVAGPDGAQALTRAGRRSAGTQHSAQRPPARRVASRSTTASGPPPRDSSVPASINARRRRSPWRYVPRFGKPALAPVVAPPRGRRESFATPRIPYCEHRTQAIF